MNEQFKKIKLDNPLVLLFLFLQFVFILLLGGVLLRSFSSEINVEKEQYSENGEIKINNLSESLPQLGKEDTIKINQALYRNVINRGTDITGEISAKIRKSSLIKKEYTDQNINYLNFIVDIPDIKQSYQIKYEWSEDGDNPYISEDDAMAITCPEEDDIIYETSSCSNFSQQTDKYSVIYQYIQYEDFGDLKVYFSETNFHEIVVDITGSDFTTDEATEYVKKWIKSMGYSARGFEFSVYNG